jgi:predicted nucleic acid-binding protein
MLTRTGAGRPRPVNDSRITACCLTYDLPLATLNVGHFDDFVVYEGLRLVTP